MRRHAERVGQPSRLWIPFAVYAAVTFVLPLIRRADRREGFWEHAAITLLVPALIVVLWAAVARVIAIVRGGCDQVDRWRR